MSQYTAEFRSFFEGPAGLSLLNWLQEQRVSEHEKAENNPLDAVTHSQTARAYREILDHIDSVMLQRVNRSPSGADA